MDVPRIAVVGAGTWGLNHARVVRDDPRCELHAIVDTDPDARARATSLVPSTIVVSDPDRVFSDPAIDACIVATPAATHVELARAALAAGKHVLVEKPVALALADARRLAATSAAAPQLVAMAGHQMVFHPAFAALRMLARERALGDLLYIHAIRAGQGRIRLDEGVMWTLGPHELSMLNALVDAPIRSVSARGRCLHAPGIDDIAFVTLHYATGQLAHLHLSRMHARKERTFTVAGSLRVARFDDLAPAKLQLYAQREDELSRPAPFEHHAVSPPGDAIALPATEPLRAQLDHFLDCIATGARPVTDVADAVRIVAILDAAQRSLALDGAPIAVTTDS
ncbi:MAG TPA: Gfo/Idh/MocA family oxidoreductase [Acidimicrobiia bacterium]|jgi:predicted dehydrogenase|nr:Gfo/Idh/MocA family oxidoreductase [Acidimicrobiia bacterium]